MGGSRWAEIPRLITDLNSTYRKASLRGGLGAPIFPRTRTEGLAMIGTRMLARLLVLALGAITFQSLVAGEPAASPPPAQSIREWKSTTPAPTPTPTPAAVPAAAPSERTLAGTSLATPAGAPA